MITNFKSPKLITTVLTVLFFYNLLPDLGPINSFGHSNVSCSRLVISSLILSTKIDWFSDTFLHRSTFSPFQINLQESNIDNNWFMDEKNYCLQSKSVLFLSLFLDNKSCDTKSLYPVLFCLLILRCMVENLLPVSSINVVGQSYPTIIGSSLPQN